MNKMRKVLIIAFLFPPIGGGGVQRTVKFVKYLPHFAWQPMVLTGKKKNYKNGWWKNTDPDLLKDLPQSVKIFRAFSLEDMLFSGKIGKAIHYLGRLLSLPDDQVVSWLVFAVKKGLKIIKEEEVDVIYSTSVPFTNHFVGMLLKKFTGRPWIADFRDPWTTNPNYRFISPLHYKIERFLEKQIYKRCDAIITTTQGYRKNILAGFSFIAPQKVHVITNGFDPEDFKSPTNPFAIFSEVLNITYLAGNSYGDKFLLPFFRGVKMLLENYPEMASRIKVNLVGEDPKGLRCLKSLGLPQNLVSFIDYVPQRDVAGYLVYSDILLAALPMGNDCIAQKIFLYLAAQRPILAVVPPGPTEEIVRKTRAGVVASPAKPREIMETVYSFIRQKERGQWEFNPDASLIQSFTSPMKTSELASIFEGVAVN